MTFHLTSPTGEQHEVYEGCKCEDFVVGIARLGSVYRTPKEAEKYAKLDAWRTEFKKVQKEMERVQKEYRKLYSSCPVPGAQRS